MKVKKYNANGDRLVPYNTIHKSIKRSTKQWKDSNGFWYKKKIKEDK